MGLESFKGNDLIEPFDVLMISSLEQIISETKSI
jgi:hypothetical protein